MLCAAETHREQGGAGGAVSAHGLAKEGKAALAGTWAQAIRREINSAFLPLRSKDGKDQVLTQPPLWAPGGLNCHQPGNSGGRLHAVVQVASLGS